MNDLLYFIGLAIFLDLAFNDADGIKSIIQAIKQ